MILDYANDNTPQALEAAAHNFRQLIDRWHSAKTCDANLDDYEGTNIAYFRDPNTGYHGWMCIKCRHVVQTG
jgi:hypothetical protein